SLVVEIQPIVTENYSAGFTLMQESGRLSRRQIVAKTCSEALDALTLLVTLALDPGDDEEPAALPAPVPPRAETPLQEAPVLPPTLPSTDRVFGLAAGAGALATWGPSPSVMPGAFLYFGADLSGQGLFSPAIRLSAAHLTRDGVSESGGTAGF